MIAIFDEYTNSDQQVIVNENIKCTNLLKSNDYGDKDEYSISSDLNSNDTEFDIHELNYFGANKNSEFIGNLFLFYLLFLKFLTINKTLSSIF